MSCGKVLCTFDNGDDVHEELLCGTTGPDDVGIHLCKDCRDIGRRGMRTPVEIVKQHFKSYLEGEAPSIQRLRRLDPFFIDALELFEQFLVKDIEVNSIGICEAIEEEHAKWAAQITPKDMADFDLSNVETLLARIKKRITEEAT